MNTLIKYFHTARHLRWEQYYYRFYKVIRPIRFNVENQLTRCRWAFNWNVPSYKEQSLFENGKCVFLNHNATIVGATDWNAPCKDKLWLYNLHYFEDLDSKDSENRIQLAEEWILKWIRDNPAALGNGWEPYPISLRVVNWIKWLSKNSIRSTVIDKSLALQTRVLAQKIEYHLLANHLFVNAQALIFAGCWFSGNQANRWLKKGLRILEREIKEQFLQDGAHFELSPMYHANLLLNVLDLLNLAYCSQNQLLLARAEQLKEVVKNGLGWLEAMMHPDGQISFFNDAAFSNAPSLMFLKEYASSLAIPVDTCFNKSSVLSYRHLANSGYIRVHSGNSISILDVGHVGPDYQPGHAHADSLSFELSIDKQRIFVNSGTSQYGIGAEREWQRSTKAHNTVAVKDLDSSEVWGGFRVARRAKPFGLLIEQDLQNIRISCSHDGYKRLKEKIIHRRDWYFTDNKLHITDSVNNLDCSAVAYYHFHPDVHVNQLGEIIEVISHTLRARMTFSKSQVLLTDSHWYPEFGVKMCNKMIKVIFSSYLETVIEWF